MAQPSDAAAIIHAWISRAGDSQVSSVINTVLYGVSVLASFYRWKTLRYLKTSSVEQRFWLLLSFVLLAFGLNKQLDLQVLLIEIGRPIAVKGGWYGSRRMVQAAFALVMTGIAGLFVTMAVSLIRKHWHHNALALPGLLILCIYAAIETIAASHAGLSFQFPERWGIRLSDLIEMGGILLILVNALNHRRRE